MPRIRYRRSHDFRLFEPADERDFIEESEEESPSGNSWLSNANMAALLSDAKIKKAIAALKAQITVLEAELLSRRFAREHEFGEDWDEIGNLRGPEDGERLYPRSDKSTSPRRNKGTHQFKKLSRLRATLRKLGVTDVESLLNEWGKIAAQAAKGESDET